MARYDDGLFQKNYDTNAFLSNIKSIKNLQVISDSMYNAKIEMSPIDFTAKSIIALAKTPSQCSVFNCQNNNFLYTKDIIEALRKAGVKPTAMMDISDGLSSELMHICSQSKVGCCIYEDKLPIDFQAAALAEEMNLNIVTCALNGGEDYELLFTCSLDDYEKLIPIEDLYIIGHITKPEYGLNLIGRNGEEITLKAQGWQAFNGQ